MVAFYELPGCRPEFFFCYLRVALLKSSFAKQRISDGAMPKRLFQANIKVSEFPRVRFFQLDRKADPAAANGKAPFVDITSRVVKLLLEELDEQTGACVVVRLDALGEVVSRTRHQSVQEAKWHAEFEYGLPEEKWSPVNE